MVALFEVVFLTLLVVAGWLWFRRTPMYRAHRRQGVVPGQTSAYSSPKYYGGHSLPLRPELRGEEAPRRPRRWGFGRHR